MDTAYISAFAALAGAAIGGLTSFASSWLTQRTQLRFTHHEAIKAKRLALYTEFADEACRLYGDAFGFPKDDARELVKIYAILGRIRVVSPRTVVVAAERTLNMIIETYLGPNLTLHMVLENARQDKFLFLFEFGEACRQDSIVGDY